MTEHLPLGRPRSHWRQVSGQWNQFKTVRTQVDQHKAHCVMGALVKKFMADYGIEHAANADEPLRKRFPKYFRGANLRVTVLRHFALVYDAPELVEILEAFHDRPDWRTAREGEALLKSLLGSLEYD